MPARRRRLYALLGIWTPAAGHMGAKGVVKERMDATGAMGRAMRSLYAMARGTTPVDGAEVARTGRFIRDYAERIPELFPEGTHSPPSEARPEIWTDWAAFEKRAGDLAGEAAKPAEVGADDDRRALVRQFRRVGRACSVCHESLRARDRRR